jgi:hypothetical protein
MKNTSHLIPLNFVALNLMTFSAAKIIYDRWDSSEARVCGKMVE